MTPQPPMCTPEGHGEHVRGWRDGEEQALVFDKVVTRDYLYCRTSRSLSTDVRGLVPFFVERGRFLLYKPVCVTVTVKQ